MLEIRNLTKIYKSKTGESVKALNNISISFPESGMIFILGKSGSGKSTLLNVIGGLDSCDKGEFIIKGKSSREFRGADLDAYRNTFVGFIFQEYNVLDDFTVGANIALALELQGKKATNEKINEILDKVDLKSYAKRKPNELSGGQKQRVAIARALVKEPQIIMADEPTGALDSNTGKQIFDTLKKLSSEKLVLIVSHDRDFAEKYADRIIELSDGSVVSDVTKHERAGSHISDGLDKITDNIFKIKKGYRLTDNDVRMINEYLSKIDTDLLVSADDGVNREFKRITGITENGGTEIFKATEPEWDIQLSQYDSKKTKFIHSRLPLKNAVKIGSSGLKHKKFRLAMTIILSTVAFTMFGMADTIAAYEKVSAATASMIDSNVNVASVTLGVRNDYYSDGKLNGSYYENDGINQDDLQLLKKKTGLDFIPVLTSSPYPGQTDFSYSENFKQYDNNPVFTGTVSGIINIDSATLKQFGCDIVAGRLPRSPGEIAITELAARSLGYYGFINEEYNEEIKSSSSPVLSDVIGKHISPFSTVQSNENPKPYEIVGIIDTDFNYDRYSVFLPSNDPSYRYGITDMILANELEAELRFGLHSLAFLCAEDIDSLTKAINESSVSVGEYMYGYDCDTYIKYVTNGIGSVNGSGSEKNEYNIWRIGSSEDIEKINVRWLTDEKKSLGKNEAIVPYSWVSTALSSQISLTLNERELSKYIDSLYGRGAFDSTDSSLSYTERIYTAANDFYLLHGKQGNAMLDIMPFVTEQLLHLNSLPKVHNRSLLLNFTYEVGNILDMFDSQSNTADIDIWSIRNLVSSVYVVAEYESLDLMSDKEYVNGILDWRNMSISDWNDLSSDEQESISLSYYEERYRYESNEHLYSDVDTTLAVLYAISEINGTDIKNTLNATADHVTRNNNTGYESTVSSYNLNIVGLIDNTDYNGIYEILICDDVYNGYQKWYSEQNVENTSYWVRGDHESGIWAFAVAPLSSNETAIERLVELSFDNSDTIGFTVQNAVMCTLSSFNEMIEVVSIVFLYLGIVLAIFASLLLMNFIGTSISYKKREIGILRAVGARSSDVFKIFFSEALIIALINFILSVAAVIAMNTFIGNALRTEGLNITLLNFGARQLLLMLAISVAVAVIASFLPVNKIARRKPIDAIKDR